MWYTSDSRKLFREGQGSSSGAGGGGWGGGGAGRLVPPPPKLPAPAPPPKPPPAGAPRGSTPGTSTSGSSSAGGKGAASKGADWGTANSSARGGTPTPDGKDYVYDLSGHKSISDLSVWKIEIRKAGVLQYSREHYLGPTGRLWIDGVTTVTTYEGVVEANPVKYNRTGDPSWPGQTVTENAANGPMGAGIPLRSLGVKITARPLNPYDDTDPVTAPSGPAPDGWEPATDFPRIPAPPALPSPAPAKKPATAPPAPAQEPAPSPATEPQPQPQPAPATDPATAPPTVWTQTTTWTPKLTPPAPSRGPGTTTATQYVGATGVAAPAPAGAPATTPAGRKVVGSVANPVTVDPAQVPETMAGIAAEIGRIESKVGSLLARPSPEGVDWQGLLDQIASLLAPDAEPIPGATYQIRRPCGRGADGGPLPPVLVQVPQAADPTVAILARLDALAELIDEQKQVRQPICKGKPGGEPVTITFERVS